MMGGLGFASASGKPLLPQRPELLSAMKEKLLTEPAAGDPSSLACARVLLEVIGVSEASAAAGGGAAAAARPKRGRALSSPVAAAAAAEKVEKEVSPQPQPPPRR